MTFRRPRRINARVRLTLLYTAISTGSVVVLFGLTFLSLYRTLQQDDQRDVQSHLLSYWAQFQSGGLDLLAREIGTTAVTSSERPYFVRVATRENETVLFAAPQQWESFDLERLEWMELAPGRIHKLSSPAHEYVLEAAGIWLSDDYFLQLGMSSRNRTRLLALFRRNFLVIAVTVVIAGFAVGLAIASRAFRPIARVTALAQRIVETGRLDERVEGDARSDELSELVDVINAMLARLEKTVDGLKSTVDMVAHDLRTPITRLRARAELALRSHDAEESRTALAETVEQTDEILRMVHTLMDITEAESGVMQLSWSSFQLCDLLGEVVDLYDLVADERDVTVDVQCPGDIHLEADRIRIRQVVSNLLDNALKYSRRGGRVTIEARTVAAPPRESITITVSDTGVGIDPEDIDRVFERMYRGPVQPQTVGLGLGLSLVRAVVSAHGGTVSIKSERGSGTAVQVTMPLRRGGAG